MPEQLLFVCLYLIGWLCMVCGAYSQKTDGAQPGIIPLQPQATRRSMATYGSSTTTLFKHLIHTMLENSDPLLNQYVRNLLGDPEKDRKVYEDTSPIKYVQNIRAPLLVLQGDNDPHVPR